jgi:hypothetical protein
MSNESLPRVPCPECGEEFIPRGLPSHRRQRHGVAIRPALPAPVPEPTANEILSALQLLRGAVARIDERIGEVEAVALHKETPEEELTRLERELAALLERIGRSQRPAGVDGPAAPLPNEELARLRLEQTRIVYRIDELLKGAPNPERFLG